MVPTSSTRNELDDALADEVFDELVVAEAQRWRARQRGEGRTGVGNHTLSAVRVGDCPDIKPEPLTAIFFCEWVEIAPTAEKVTPGCSLKKSGTATATTTTLAASDITIDFERPRWWYSASIGRVKDAGAEWRESGCSMCLGMNGDTVPAGRYCVSTSNRNFEGRQGIGARTLLASPMTAAASAVQGRIADPRELLR